jgi:sugar phosphate isomerase/epimerase
VFIMAKRPHASLLDMPLDRCDDVRALCAELSLEVMGLAAYTDFAAVTGAEVPLGEYQVAAVDALCRITAGLGGEFLRVFTGYRSPGLPDGHQARRVVDGLREAADCAAGHGVVLGLQNHHDLAVDTDAFAALLREVDHEHCQAMYDAWSPALRGEDLYQGALALGARTVNTTVADYVRQPRWRYCPEQVNYERVLPDQVQAVPLGDGLIDYAAFTAGLIDGGFRGWVTYEMCSPLRDGGSEAVLDRYARGALEVIRSWELDPA